MLRRPRFQLSLNMAPTEPSDNDNIRTNSYSVMEAGGICEERVTKSTIATILKYICSLLCSGMRNIQIDLDEEEIVITDFVVTCDSGDQGRSPIEYPLYP